MIDAFFCDLNIFSWEFPPPKTLFSYPKNKFFFKKNFFKENFQIFCMNFLWQISSKSRQIWGTYAGGEQIFCSKELSLFFDKSGVRISGGDFLFKGIAFGFWDFLVKIQGNFSKEIFLFLRNFSFGVRIPGGGKCLDHKKQRQKKNWAHNLY